MSQPTASRFMNVARAYGDKVFTVNSLDPGALYELASPEVREEIERMIEAGDVVTKTTVARLKAEAAQKGNAHAEEDAEIAERQVAALRSGMDELNQKIDARVSQAIRTA